MSDEEDVVLTSAAGGNYCCCCIKKTSIVLGASDGVQTKGQSDKRQWTKGQSLE